MATKKTTFNPDAIDADGDGIVQEGTEFERPLGQCCAKDECEECPFDEPEVVEVVAEIPSAPTGKTYTAKDGDTYASIAAAHKPAGVKSFDYAQTLYEANNAKPIRAGVEVTL